MGVIAVAGGSGQVGKAIVDGLVKHGRHTILSLSRHASDSSDGVSNIQVDYSDVDGLHKALEKNQVDTLVCAIGVFMPAMSAAQINLIQAAEKAACTKRFVISSFDLLHQREHISINPLALHTFEAVDELEKTNLEWTRIGNGWFTDFYGIPHYETHLHPWINILNMQKKWAVIPGDGNGKATFITSQDFANFFAHLMDLETWSKITLIKGETITFNDLLALAEEARGCKFNVAYDSLEKLKSGKLSFFPDYPAVGLGEGDEAFLAGLHYQAGKGQFLVPDENTLNQKFPDIKITSIREVLQGSWAGRLEEAKNVV